MGRHSSSEDEDQDDLDAEALLQLEELVSAGSVVETGRHFLPELTDSAQPRDVEFGGPAKEVAGATEPAEPAAADAIASDATTGDAKAVNAIASDAKADARPNGSRAGRNLPAAIVVGLALGALVLCALLIYRVSFVAIVSIAVMGGVYEMVRAIGTVEARPPLVPLLVGAVAMDVSAWSQGPNGLIVGFLLTVLGITVWRLGDGAVGYQRDVATAAFVAMYVPLLAGFAVLLAHYDDGAGRVIAFIATVVCSDVGGYAAGVLFGKHPMAPTVSPKKSWEGFTGSALASALAGGLLLTLTFHGAWWSGVLYGLAIAATATLGDLGESMIKRDLGIKDMGKLLPGHGGLMDRLDSLLPCAVVAYLIFAAAVPH